MARLLCGVRRWWVDFGLYASHAELQDWSHYFHNFQLDFHTSMEKEGEIPHFAALRSE